jgi:hypothetical protein
MFAFQSDNEVCSSRDVPSLFSTASCRLGKILLSINKNPHVKKTLDRPHWKSVKYPQKPCGIPPGM